jgi:hypothetical protein
MISQLDKTGRNGAGGGGISGGSISNAFTTLMNYLRGHIGYWDRVDVTTGATGLVTIAHNCGFTPSAAFVQGIYDGVHPHNHYGPINIVSLDETNMTILMLRANGNDDANSARTVYYHILPVVKER